MLKSHMNTNDHGNRTVILSSSRQKFSGKCQKGQ